MQNWVSKKQTNKQKQKQNKKTPMFSKIMGRSEKDKQTPFLGLNIMQRKWTNW